MGFSSGFTGGVTLTLGLAYLTVLAHERNRRAQADALRSQSRVLNGLFEPAPIPDFPTRAELAREERTSLVETAKDRWNDEIEGAVRWVQRKDWNAVREGMEEAVSKLLSGGLQKSREGVEEAEKQAAPRIQEAVEKSKAFAQDAKSRAATGINDAAAAGIAGAERAGAQAKDATGRATTAAKSKADDVAASTKDQLHRAQVKTAEAGSTAKATAERKAAEAKSGAQDAADAIKHPGGTVDAVRGAIRDAVNTGIEKGKEAVGKAQAAVGLATEKIESKVQSSTLSHSSAVEKALHERYEKPKAQKSVEEVLAERYKPIDSRDNTVLRGV